MPAPVRLPRPGRLMLGSAPPWWRGRRWRLLRVALAAGLAVIAAALVARSADQARATVAAYGTVRRVAVARHDLGIGQRITASDLAWPELPVAAVPSHVAGASPVGRTVVDAIGRGEVITDPHLAPGGLSGLAALVPAGGRAVAVPVPGAGLRLVVGDLVDVLAPDRAPSAGGAYDSGAAESAGARTVARRARVIEVDGADVVVAVSEDEAAGVAGAMAEGTPVVVLDGAG